MLLAPNCRSGSPLFRIVCFPLTCPEMKKTFAPSCHAFRSPVTALVPPHPVVTMAQPNFPLMGIFGICMDGVNADSEFDYWIADDYTAGQPIPEGCATLEIPGGTWAVFPCTLATLQQTNTRMWKEWLPNCREYRLGGKYDVEMYGPFCEADPGASYVELWLPVEKV